MELKESSRASRIGSVSVLIVPFMELKEMLCGVMYRNGSVLIVPFMELKGLTGVRCAESGTCLNRTFYGIERSAAAARALLPRMS